MSPAALQEQMADGTERFTPWFKMEWQHLNEAFAERLAAYPNPA